MYDPRNAITNSVMQQQPGAGAMPGQPPPQMSATAGIPQQPAMPQAPLGGIGNMTGTMAGTPAIPGGPAQFPNQSMMEGLKAGAGAGNVTPLAGSGNFAMPGLGQQTPPGLGQQMPPGLGQMPPGLGQMPPGLGQQQPPGLGGQQPPGLGRQQPRMPFG